MNVPGGQVLALSGDTCNVTGTYATTANGAIRAGDGPERADYRTQRRHGDLLDHRRFR